MGRVIRIIHKLRPELLDRKLQVIREGQIQDVFADVFPKEVNADTKSKHPFPQRAISRTRGLAARQLEQRFVGPAGIMAIKAAADRMISVTYGILTPVQKLVDRNAHHGQSVLIRSRERNLFSVLTTHIEAVRACNRRSRKRD